LTRVALVEAEGEVARMRDRDHNVDILLGIDFEGEFMLQRKIDDLSAVDTNR
jgi:hypothetical protein